MSDFDLDIKSIKKLAQLLSETGLTEIEYAEGERRIRCVRATEPATVTVAAPAAVPVQQAPEAPPPVPVGTPVTSPMVGTVYLSPEPGAEPFVKEGDKVKKGDTLLIIEAMKVMNPIKAPKAGQIGEIPVSDAQPVEFGELLMTII